MEHDEFIGQVQSRCRLPSRGDAERATRAVLETLAQRMQKDAADNLAAQLPHEIGEHLRRRAEIDIRPERLDRDEFIDMVSEKAGVDPPQAAYFVRAVLEVLHEATTPQLMDKVQQQFPDDFAALFHSGSQGSMR